MRELTDALASNGFPDNLLRCPKCGLEQMHPVIVRTNAGGIITTVNHEGTRVDRGPLPGRGVVSTVMFHCEEGHVSELRLALSKGTTGFIFQSTGNVADREPAAAIWRD